MIERAVTGGPGDRLSLLVSELLDASADTVELFTGDEAPIRRTAHLDYLRALQRTGKELLARSDRRELR